MLKYIEAPNNTTGIKVLDSFYYNNLMTGKHICGISYAWKAYTYVALGSTKDLEIEINNAPENTLLDNGNLYFTKSSVFPRFKLKGTTYKKVNNVANADFVIYTKTNQTTGYTNEHVAILKSKDDFIILKGQALSIYNMSGIEGIINTMNQIIKAVPNYIDSFEEFKSKTWEHFYTGIITEITAATYQTLETLNNYPKNILITDSQLEKKISNSLNPIGLDEIKTIIEFLKSPEPDNWDLGWKMLQGMNVGKIPNVIEYIMFKYADKMSRAILNSAGMHSLISAYNFDRDIILRGGIKADYHLCKRLFQKSLNDEERYLIQSLIQTGAEIRIKETFNKLLEEYSIAGLNLSYNIQWEDFNN